MAEEATGYNERSIVFLVGAVQFINILDFMIVMPLGPDFATSLGIPISALGLVGGSYTAAAAISGLLGALVLDRFERRRALGVTLLGLAVGTAAGAFATGLSSLLAARVLAGAFGGPATSVALSIIADTIPPERRGRALGAVAGAFAAASVLGVPAGLELAARVSWRAPFLAVASLGLLITIAAVAMLPDLRAHLDTKRQNSTSFSALLQRPEVWLSYLLAALSMGAGFILIPNISGYVQANLHYPRESLGRLYMMGGAVSFLTSRLSGFLTDRIGGFWSLVPGAALGAFVTWAGFYRPDALLSVPIIFVLFMFASALRMVPFNTITSRVPRAEERARYMSLLSVVQHFASAAGAFVSSKLLLERADHRIEGMPTVAGVSILLGLLTPIVFGGLEYRLRRGSGPAVSAT